MKITDVYALRQAIATAIAEDWELVKDTAGAYCDREAVFEMAYRFGWHAATKYLSNTDNDADGRGTGPSGNTSERC